MEWERGAPFLSLAAIEALECSAEVKEFLRAILKEIRKPGG
jgi:hypothetical protein